MSEYLDEGRGANIRALGNKRSFADREKTY